MYFIVYKNNSLITVADARQQDPALLLGDKLQQQLLSPS